MVAISLPELNEILKGCKPEILEDSVAPFDYQVKTNGIGCYLCTSQQRIPIVVKKMENLNEKVKQMTSEFTLILDGKIVDYRFDKSNLYKFASIKIQSKDIAGKKEHTGGKTHLSSEIQQLKYNKSFQLDLQALVSKYAEENDAKIVFNAIKSCLEKL